MPNAAFSGNRAELMAAMLKIGGIVPFTTIDYPGKLAAVIFCQGCPWRCGYCHNPELLSENSDHGIPLASVMEFLERRRGLLDAMVFSGGEPTMQPGLVTVMADVKRLGFLVGLHTSGAFPRRLARVLPFTDWVGMDIKAPFDEYEVITGVPGSGEAARQSSGLLRQSGVPHQFRTTLDPFLLENGRLEKLRSQVARELCAEIETQRVTPCG